MQNKKNFTFILLIGIVWGMLAVVAWFHPATAVSLTERRPLAQRPVASMQSIINGSFMDSFENYAQDQFPSRDLFRRIKAIYHYYVANQKDNQGIYLHNGYAAKIEYPLNRDSVQNAVSKFKGIYNSYIEGTGSRVFYMIIPDKGIYLADTVGAPKLNDADLKKELRNGLSYADEIVADDLLDISAYYRTDIHWRQEKLLPVAQRICEELGVSYYEESECTIETLSDAFYGVYYGQVSLPMQPDSMCIIRNDIMDQCVALNFETNTETSLIDRSKLDSKDLYDVFLSGSVSMLTITNPEADSDKELVVFRDSFGSSLAPLLTKGYHTITLVDIRYVSSKILDRFLDFHGQDILFLYSVPVLNNSVTMK